MIVSVSRRTDIPAFYSEWFFNRLEAGYVLVRNPMNFKQVSKVSLSKRDVDCFVFWTKDPAKMLDRLEALEGYNYYFQFTLTPYDTSIESNVPEKEALVATFKSLSQMIGRERIIWRYDPIILTDRIDLAYHFKVFEDLASELCGYTDKCVISFLDVYDKTKRNMKSIDLKEMTREQMIAVGQGFGKIGKRYGLKMETCTEQIALEAFGIDHGKCIDDELISRILNKTSVASKDKNQREACGCITSVDIGMYNTCPHQCKYCYANYNSKAAGENFKMHDPSSPLLFGALRGDEKITTREMKSCFTDSQLSFLDPVKNE